MFELLALFMTGGGSAALGSILKGVFGSLADSRANASRIELTREARNNDNAIKFQKVLMGGKDNASSKYVRATRRLLAVICVSTLCIITILCVIYPSVPLVTLSNISGEGTRSFLFGLYTVPVRQAPMALTTGHIAVFEATVVFPMIIGFYFTPGGRR